MVTLGMRAPVTVEGRRTRMLCCLGENCSLEHSYWKRFWLKSATGFLKVSEACLVRYCYNGFRLQVNKS